MSNSKNDDLHEKLFRLENNGYRLWDRAIAEKDQLKKKNLWTKHKILQKEYDAVNLQIKRLLEKET